MPVTFVRYRLEGAACAMTMITPTPMTPAQALERLRWQYPERNPRLEPPDAQLRPRDDHRPPGA